MLVLEAKLKGKENQYNLIDEAIRTTTFLRNKALRLWMDVKALSERNHQSSHCVTMLNRDHNAALNILAIRLNRVGHTQINACGEFDLCQVDVSLLD